MVEEKTEAQRRLEEFDKRCQPKLTTNEKALASFKTLKADDKRWTHKSAITCGNCYVFVETKDGIIPIFSKKLGETIGVRFEWWLVHVMDSTKLRPTSFKAFLHQGIWRFAASAWVLQRARGVKFDFGPPPAKGLPFMAQRDEMVRGLAATLGVKVEEASRLFYEWTSH